MTPDPRSPLPCPVPAARGVHSYVEQLSGATVYCAITSDGQLLNGELRRRQPEESEAMLVRDMWHDLQRQDAVTGPPTLSLYVSGARRR